MTGLSSGTAQLIATGVQVAATAAGTYAQISASKAAASNAKQSGKVAKDQAAARAAQIRQDAQRLRGSQIAAIGASGIRSDAFNDVIADSDYEAELDALSAEYNGAMESNSYKSQARQYQAAGTQAAIGGVIGAGAQALGGYASWKKSQDIDALLAGKV